MKPPLKSFWPVWNHSQQDWKVGQHARNKNDDQNSSARLVAVSESGNHLLSFSNLIVFTMSFALTDHYGKPNSNEKNRPRIEQVLAEECGPEAPLYPWRCDKKDGACYGTRPVVTFVDGVIMFAATEKITPGSRRFGYSPELVRPYTRALLADGTQCDFNAADRGCQCRATISRSRIVSVSTSKRKGDLRTDTSALR